VPRLPLLIGVTLGQAASPLATPSPLSSTRDPLSQILVALIIVSVFVLLAMEKAHRVLVILSAVALLWLITYLTPYHLISFEASHEAIDLNVILLLASMMAVVGVLKSTGVFTWAVARLLRAAGGRPLVLMAILIWFTGILSSLADNVTTVIFATPMALEVAGATGVAAPAFLLPMVMAANIGGTATLIGDPPNILIGSGAGLSFLEFLINLTAPVLCMMVLLEWVSARYFRSAFRAGRASLDREAVELPPLSDLPLLRWALVISGLIFVGFFTHSMTGMPAAVPAAIGAAAILLVQDVFYLRARDPSMRERIHGILHVIEREIEWPTLSFFALLFIAVGAAVQTGLIDTLAAGVAGFVDWGRLHLGLSDRGTLYFASMLVLWASGVFSALIDNIPYVAVTIPLIATLTRHLTGDTEILWWALSLGACLGGNGTLIGASANVTVIGLAEKASIPISFLDFTRFGARVTVMTLTASSIFLAGFVFLGRLPTHLTTVGVFVSLLFLRWAARRAAAPAA
jgi:Na+/H+ antiporter NhaD/arsenite permease-like protein